MQLPNCLIPLLTLAELLYSGREQRNRKSIRRKSQIIMPTNVFELLNIFVNMHTHSVQESKRARDHSYLLVYVSPKTL